MNYYVLSDDVHDFTDSIIKDVRKICYDYHKELNQYDDEFEPRPEDVIVEQFNSFMENSDFYGEESLIDFVYIISRNENELEVFSRVQCVGFLIIEKNTPESKLPPEADYFIIDSYIKPEFRGKDLMKSALISYLCENRGDYLYYVLNKNENAKTFWSLMFEKTLDKKIEVANQFNEFDKNNITMYKVTV